MRFYVITRRVSPYIPDSRKMEDKLRETLKQRSRKGDYYSSVKRKLSQRRKDEIKIKPLPQKPRRKQRRKFNRKMPENKGGQNNNTDWPVPDGKWNTDLTHRHRAIPVMLKAATLKNETKFNRKCQKTKEKETRRIEWPVQLETKNETLISHTERLHPC